MFMLRQGKSAILTVMVFSCPMSVLADASPINQPSITNSTRAEPITPNPQERLAHSVVTGSIGPWSKAQVWLTTSKTVEDAPFKAFVVIKTKAGQSTTYTLPPPDQQEEFFMMKVRTVMFRPTPGNAEQSLIILYSESRIGPRQPITFGALVYKWENMQFQRDNHIETLLAGVRNNTEATSRLKSNEAKK